MQGQLSSGIREDPALIPDFDLIAFIQATSRLLF
jgi:hypothetical protein